MWKEGTGKAVPPRDARRREAKNGTVQHAKNLMSFAVNGFSALSAPVLGALALIYQLRRNSNSGRQPLVKVRMEGAILCTGLLVTIK